MQDVKGKAAFVTGGVSGIGLGIAKAFADAGMKVAISHRRRDHLDAALAHFEEPGLRCGVVQDDPQERNAIMDVPRGENGARP